MKNKLCMLLITALVLGPGHAHADITNPGDPIRGVPGDGDWPGNEAPPLVITDYHHHMWWNRLFEDQDFWQRCIDRWY